MTSKWKPIGAVAPIAFAGALFAADPAAALDAQPGCKFANGIKRVVHITFDNVHLRRDNPNVPSDLEQMPSLLNFMSENGTVGANHHMPLISHTATDILTALSGLYPDRMGVPVSNSYRVFDGAGNVSGSHPSFIYWTATDATDGKPVMINENGKAAPAPWASFTRLGCDVGAFSVANMEFETLPGDIATVFGPNSPETTSVKAELASPSAATRQKANTDWLGIAVHCAQNSKLCANGSPDALPDEPGGYNGFKALFGNINVQPAIASGPVKDLDGNVIADGFAQPGFPNIFSPTATQSLGYMAQMLQAGVQVVYGYIADAHDNRTGPGTFGPGEAGYVAQLKQYDAAFAAFFARLKTDGFDQSNTLFIITADEGDHFVGGTPSPANCDGVTVPCNYVDPTKGNARTVGELTANLDSLLLTQRGNTTPFLVHSDDAPNIYIKGNPGPTDPVTRTLEKDIGALTFANPLFGKNNQVDVLAPFLADRAEMKFLHMVTTSPARTPSFTVFGNPDYFFQTTKGSLPLAPQDCSANPSLCVFQNSAFAWNHGDVQHEIVTNFLGMVGPGVRKTGVESAVFSDHTDIRPTMLALLGMVDDYVSDGRVLIEKFDEKRRNAVLKQNQETYQRLAAIYKQITAPVGALGLQTLGHATTGINGDDATYTAWLAFIDALTTQRDALVGQIRIALNDAIFGDGKLTGPAEHLAQQGAALLGLTQHAAAQAGAEN
jgi:hypothetical protein